MRNRVSRVILVVAAVTGALIGGSRRPGYAQGVALTIPSAHPRLWWTPSRITQAKQWYAAHPFNAASSDYIGQALLHVLDPAQNNCSAAVNWAAGFTMNVSGVASDEARWDGEQVILIFDWCNDQWSSSQTSTLLNRWNGYVSTLNAKQWGGPGMESNNYYWGYLRNSFEWGIATYYEQQSTAQGFLDNALVTRWQNGELPLFSHAAKGGVFPEGSQYGRYMASYPIIPLTSAALMGRSMITETNFYREAAMNMIYQTTPQPTHATGSSSTYYQTLPFDDDEADQAATDSGWGDFMSMIAMNWSSSPLGQLARQWLATVSPSRSTFIQSVDAGGSTRSFSTLPLDYFSPGMGYLYALSKWGTGSSYLQVQTSLCTTCGHTHGDNGNFHIERNGYWLTKESTGYSVSIAGWGGAGGVDASDAAAHNVMFYNGSGPNINYAIGRPAVVRLESNPNYAYMASDLSIAFHSSDSRFDNSAADTTVREYLFVRPLETLVLLDRMRSTSSSAQKGIAVHFENSPSVTGTRAVGQNGTQALEVTSVLPASSATRVITEGSAGRYRLELETSGLTQTYFLTVLQARDASAAGLTINSSEDANTITLTLQSDLGSAKIIFNKGATSSGGQFGFSPTQAIPTSLNALYSGVQAISVTDTGVAWANISGGTTPPSPPTGVRVIQ